MKFKTVKRISKDVIDVFGEQGRMFNIESGDIPSLIEALLGEISPSSEDGDAGIVLLVCEGNKATRIKYKNSQDARNIICYLTGDLDDEKDIPVAPKWMDEKSKAMSGMVAGLKTRISGLFSEQKEVIDIIHSEIYDAMTEWADEKLADFEKPLTDAEIEATKKASDHKKNTVAFALAARYLELNNFAVEINDYAITAKYVGKETVGYLINNFDLKCYDISYCGGDLIISGKSKDQIEKDKSDEPASHIYSNEESNYLAAAGYLMSKGFDVKFENGGVFAYAKKDISAEVKGVLRDRYNFGSFFVKMTNDTVRFSRKTVDDAAKTFSDQIDEDILREYEMCGVTS